MPLKKNSKATHPKKETTTSETKMKGIANPVVIKWVDIVSWSGWNQELIDKNLDVPAPFTTIGFLVRMDEEKVTISDSYPDMGNITVFPQGCVKEIIELKI